MKYILEKTGLTYLMQKIKEFFIKKPAGGTQGQVLMMGSSEPEWSNLPTMLTYKGQLSTESDLANVQNPSIGDVYFIVDSSKEFVCIDNTTSPVTWEALGIDQVQVDWDQIDQNAKDYIKNKPTEPGSNGYFVRYNNNNQYSWTEGLSLQQFNELERYPVHNYLSHLVAAGVPKPVKVIELSKDNINGNTVFVFDLIILSNNYQYNSNNYYYYTSYTVLVQLIGNQWQVQAVCKGRVNFGSSNILENSLRASYDNNKLTIAWASGVSAGGFNYYVASDIRTDGTYTADQIRQNNIFYYNTAEEGNNIDSINRATIFFNNLIISNLSSDYIISINQCKKTQSTFYNTSIDIQPTSTDNIILKLNNNYTLTIKGESSIAGSFEKNAFIYNDSGSPQTLTIQPDTNFNLHNLYDNSGSTCTITVPNGKCLQLTITYWKNNEAVWDGKLES